MKYLLLFFLLTASCLSQFKTETVTLVTFAGEIDSIKVCDVKAGTVVAAVVVYADTLIENLATLAAIMSQSGDTLLGYAYDVELDATGQARSSRLDSSVGMFDDYIMLHWTTTGPPVTGRVKVYVETILIN
jgi:hypothetical protein